MPFWQWTWPMWLSTDVTYQRPLMTWKFGPPLAPPVV
jgi:hypothetical protein